MIKKIIAIILCIAIILTACVGCNAKPIETVTSTPSKTVAFTCPQLEFATVDKGLLPITKLVVSDSGEMTFENYNFQYDIVKKMLVGCKNPMDYGFVETVSNRYAQLEKELEGKDKTIVGLVFYANIAYLIYDVNMVDGVGTVEEFCKKAYDYNTSVFPKPTGGTWLK